MGEKTFLVGVWMERGEGKKLVGPGCFLPNPTKMFFPQNREKTWWGFWISWLIKMLNVTCTWVSSSSFFMCFLGHVASPFLFFSFLFSFFFFSFAFLDVATYFFFFFFFSFDFLGCEHDSCFVFLFFVFIYFFFFV